MSVAKRVADEMDGECIRDAVTVIRSSSLQFHLARRLVTPCVSRT